MMAICCNNPYEDYIEDDESQRMKLLPKRIEANIMPLLNSYIGSFNLYEVYRKDQDEHAFVGDAGIAYTFYRLAKSSLTNNEERVMYLKKAQVLIDVALNKIVEKLIDLDSSWNDLKIVRPPYIKDVGIVCGTAGIYMLSAAISYALDLKHRFNDELQNFYSYLAVALSKFNKQAGDVFLVGRAGYLAGLYWLNKECPGNGLDARRGPIWELCELLYKNGEQYATENKLRVPLMYACYEKEYLGASNGISGILFMLLKSPWFEDYPKAECDPEQRPYCQNIRRTIDAILALQNNSGNFPKLYRDQRKHIHHYHYYNHNWLQWCDGTPGIVYLMAKAYLTFNDVKYLESCERACDYIWKYGLTLKGPALCDGIFGNAYTFLIMYRMTKNRKYLYRALKFVDFTQDDNYNQHIRVPDFMYSLYLGTGGLICFLIDLLDPMNASFPFFDLN